MPQHDAVSGEVEWNLKVGPVNVATAQALEVHQVPEVPDLKTKMCRGEHGGGTQGAWSPFSFAISKNV